MKDLRLACFGISNGALKSDALPSSLTLLAWGENPTDRGVRIVNEQTEAAVQQQVAAGVFDRVLVDFEHNSCKGHPNYQPPPRKHAGAGTVFCSGDRGLGIEGVEWTPHGKEFAPDYPDLSPAILEHRASGVVMGLQSVGLVPNGGVVGLSFFSPITDDYAKGSVMDIEALATKVQELEAQLTEALKNGTEGGEPQIAALSAKIEELSGKVTALSADLEKRDRDAVLARAAAAGKVVALSAEAVAKLSVEELEAHVEALPVTVPVDRRTPKKRRQATGTAPR
jgi:Mu-like prophage I protein.